MVLLALAFLVPATVAAIFFVLFLLFGSLRYATLIIMVLPLASIGGIVGLFISGQYLSVPASVGFIALWGIAVLIRVAGSLIKKSDGGCAESAS